MDGLRDSFIENDVIGNTNVGSASIFGRARSAFRKKRKKFKRRIKRAFGKKKKVRHVRKHKFRRHKKRSGGSVKFTKNGQPYKIMPNGRARFLKKR